MNTFDRYLLREWLRILGLVLAGTMGLLLVQVMFNDFRQLRDLGAHGADLVVYFFVTMPSFLALVLPLALLVSLLFVLGTLHRTNQLNAMRGAGLGYLRITRSIWLVGALCCGLTLWLNSTVVPWSVEKSRELNDSFEIRNEAGKVPLERIGALGSVGFVNVQADRMWWFNHFSPFSSHGYGVSVYTTDRAHRPASLLLAKEAFAMKGGGWRFLAGQELAFDAVTGVVQSRRPFDEKTIADFNEDPGLMVLLDGSRRAVDLSIRELARVRDYYAADGDPKGVPYAVRYFGILADTLSPLIVIAIAIPFAVSGVRVNPAVGVSKAIGLFGLYYVLVNVALSLALRGVVSPDLAAWLPNICLSILAAWFFVRLR